MRPNCKRLLVVTLGTLTLAIAACGGASSGAAADSPGMASSRPADGKPSPSPSPSPRPSAPATTANVFEVNATGRGGAFDPPQLGVAIGTTVHFKNVSGNIHNVTFNDSSIKSSGVMSPGDGFDVTFPMPGTYTYRCTFHPGMDGTITVK